MPFTPRNVIKTHVERKTSRVGYYCEATVFLPTKTLKREWFCGKDGRKVRADAIAWACEAAEDMARALGTAWRSPRDSRNPYMN